MPTSKDSTSVSARRNFELALKHMTPLPSVTEQHVVLDEFSLHLSHFSIAINRLVCSEADDQNAVQLLRLLSGMYSLLKTTLLSPKEYSSIVESVTNIEESARRYLRVWSSKTLHPSKELFELAWYNEAVIPRALLATCIFSSCPQLWKDPECLASVFEAASAIQHPLKGSLLFGHMHSTLQAIYKEADDGSEESVLLLASLHSYSLEVVKTLVKFHLRWSRNEVRGDVELRRRECADLLELSLKPVLGQIAETCHSVDTFEEVFLSGLLSECISCNDAQAQTMLIESIVSLFPAEYIHAAMGTLIRAIGQLSTDVDVRLLLSYLFNRILAASNTVHSPSDRAFFESVWEELATLIKARSDIDPRDTVQVASVALDLAAKVAPGQLELIDAVLRELWGMLRAIRPAGFGEASEVGRELVSLLEAKLVASMTLAQLLSLEMLPDVISGNLDAASARACCLRISDQFLASPSTTRLSVESVPRLVRLFAPLTQKDLMHMLAGDEENVDVLAQITADLESFAIRLPNLVASQQGTDNALRLAMVLFHELNASSCTLMLFLVPVLVERIITARENEAADANELDMPSDGTLLLLKEMIASLLTNTSTTLPPDVLERLATSRLPLITLTYPKTLAIDLNFRVAEWLDRKLNCPAACEFFTDILVVVNQQLAHEPTRIEVLQRSIEALRVSQGLEASDVKTLTENISGQVSGILRKPDRIELLLSLLSLDRVGWEKDRWLRLVSSVAGLLEHLLNVADRLDKSVRFLEAVFSSGEDVGDDQLMALGRLFNWIGCQEASLVSAYELRLYPLRMHWSSQHPASTRDDESGSVAAQDVPQDVPLVQELSEDLKRLRAFESFPSNDW